MSAEAEERRDLVTWLVLVVLGLAMTWVFVQAGAALGTKSAPFLGSYRYLIGLSSLFAPIVAFGVLAATARDRFATAPWLTVLALGWAGSFAWAVSLAAVDGVAGLTRSLDEPSNYFSDAARVDNPWLYLGDYTTGDVSLSTAARGHPPGPVILLWLLEHYGITDRLTIGILVTVVGAFLTPLVLSAVRGVCGEDSARAFAPVLILAPYWVWVAVSIDVVVAVLGAAMVAMGVRASAHDRTGWRAGAWALASGITLGVAALFSYAAPWLGLSVVCLYFARRRALLIAATGGGALLPVLAAHLAGFTWLDGLLLARDDYVSRVEPNRSALAWSFISVVVLLLATGPPLIRSLRRLRNTPGWPFLVGAGVAVAFSVLSGLARGGAEAAWLPFFPWLTVAAIAPTKQGGEASPTPMLLVGAGSLVAIIVEAVLATPW